MKWYSVFMIVFLCTACSNDGGTEKDPSDQFHVDILFSTSGLGDSGYNDAILYGIQQASMKHGFKVNFHQPKTMEAGWECYQEWLNEPDDAVKKLFIFASNDYEKQLRANHPSTKENRDILFFESDSPIENVGSFRLNMYGASYYIGKLAGSIVPTAATLMANPYDTPITESEEGFRAGFCSESEPDNYDVFCLTDDKHKGYNMPDSAYRITYKIAQTHSFVWPLAGGSNIGVFQYTREYLPTLFTAGMDVDMSGKVTNDDLLNIAEDLVMKYASAKLVITSRIHAGLPCLGVETPVVFIANEEVVSQSGTFNTPGRLGGLLELFRVITVENGAFLTEDETLAGFDKFTEHTVFQNKTDWKQYADKLEKKATEFMKD